MNGYTLNPSCWASKKIREDKNSYQGFVDTRELKKAFKTLKSQETRVKTDYP